MHIPIPMNHKLVEFAFAFVLVVALAWFGGRGFGG